MQSIELLGEGQVSISYFYFDLYVFGLMLESPFLPCSPTLQLSKGLILQSK